MIELEILNNELDKNELLLNHLLTQINKNEIDDEDLNECHKAIKALRNIIPGIKHSIKVLELLHNIKTIKDA